MSDEAPVRKALAAAKLNDAELFLLQEMARKPVARIKADGTELARSYMTERGDQVRTLLDKLQKAGVIGEVKYGLNGQVAKIEIDGEHLPQSVVYFMSPNDFEAIGAHVPRRWADIPR